MTISRGKSKTSRDVRSVATPRKRRTTGFDLRGSRISVAAEAEVDEKPGDLRISQECRETFHGTGKADEQRKAESRRRSREDGWGRRLWLGPEELFTRLLHRIGPGSVSSACSPVSWLSPRCFWSSVGKGASQTRTIGRSLLRTGWYLKPDWDDGGQGDLPVPCQGCAPPGSQ